MAYNTYYHAAPNINCVAPSLLHDEFLWMEVKLFNNIYAHAIHGETKKWGLGFAKY